MMQRIRYFEFLIGLTLLLCFNSVQSGQQDWIYIVTKDDTLWDLSKKYLPSVRYWKKFQKLNGITYPKKIRPGTRLRIPLAWLSDQPVPAKAVAVDGNVSITPSDSRSYRQLQVDTPIRLGDRVETGPDSSVAVEFADGSVITIRQQSVVFFNHLSAYSDTGMVDTRLRLSRGRVDIRAKPAVGPGSRFEIHSPSAVSAVRGTEYRAAAEDAGNATWVEVIEGTVAATGASKTALVPASFGTKVVKGEEPLPPVPLLEAPRLDPLPETIQRLNWPLSWQPVTGAKGYRLEISSEADFTLIDWEASSKLTRISLPDLADGEYFVRVRGIDDLGIEGLNRVVSLILDARPQPPVSLEPADGAILRGVNPRLHWSASAEALSYRLQLARDDGFTDLLTEQYPMSVTAFEPENLPPGSYHWRVASISETAEQGPFGPPRSFELKPLPDKPLATLAETDTSIMASWQAGLAGQTYQVQLADDRDFTNLLLDRTVNEPQIEIPQVTGMVRYLRVRIVESDGFQGPWGAVQQIDPLPDKGWIYLLLTAVLGFLMI